MTKAVTYLPFEGALDRFAWDTSRGAETRTKCASSEDISSDEMIDRRENIR